MAGLRSMFKRFSQECETADQHQEEALQTHYYKATFDKVFEEVKRFYSSPAYSITSVSKEHGEIMVQKKSKPSMFLIVTVVSVRPFQTAVDIKASPEQMIVSGAYPLLKKEIESCYHMLGQQLHLADK